MNYKTYGWYQKGSHPEKPIVFNKYHRTYLMGALSTKGFIIANQYEKINGESFLAFVESLVKLYPKLVLIMDNVGTHLTTDLRNFYKTNNIVIIRFPKYSPQLNPIEQYWKNIKQWLGTKLPLTYDGLKTILGRALKDTSLWPKSYGYLVT